jgi:metal-responsive CopG/Arc/MetJ family transcriptional regulator
MRRIHIYLENDQISRLEKRAATDGITRSKVIRRAVDEFLTQDEQDTAAWRLQWRKAVQETAGIASYLEEGPQYVETLRREDADRLSGFKS